MNLPPVVWKPTTKFMRRDGQPVLAFVRHRIVGSLTAADGVFVSTNPKPVSTHLAIGHVNGVLKIHQYVDLSDAAWGNGTIDRPTAKVVLARPGVNPNSYSVSIEHEDGGSAGMGVVQPDTWAVSIQLGLLLASGNLSAIRAAGIHIRDSATATQLFNVPKTLDGYLDHHQITYGKVYCWRRWLNDPGFVEGSPSRRDQLLTALTTGVMPDTSTGDDMPTFIAFTPGTIVVGTGSWVHTKPDVLEASRWTQYQADVTIPSFAGYVRGEMVEAVDQWAAFWVQDSGKWAYTHKSNVLSVKPLTAVADSSAFTAEIAEQQATINSQTARISALAGAVSAKDSMLDAAMLHEKPHVDLSAALQAARSR